ncbi:MAG: TRZ/ATZ family hydrolase [Gammaproteobacteria bacterium]|nr:TRZ/ATZ family hydrolase [Gammaproteobacteria bacterium]
MHPAELIISARWIVPVEPAGAVLAEHAIVVRDGRILAVLPCAEALELYPSAGRVDRPHHVLLPGLVNTHTHAAMTLLRGMADDLPLETWLNQHIWPTETRWVTPEFVRDGTELALLEMLQGGTTSFGDMYFFPDVVARAVADSGLRAAVGMIVLEQATVWAQSADEYLSKGLAVRDQFKAHPRVSTLFAPHAPYSVADRTFGQIRVLADELDVPIHMHVHETAAEVAMGIGEYRCRPLQRLDTLGMVTPLLAAAHMTQLEPDEIALLASRGSTVIHCPESNLKLASGMCPVARLVDAGVNVALGTDGAASNNDLDMFGEMRTAALLAKGIAGRAEALPAAMILQMATLNGAAALGLADRIGSLLPGKEADLICVDLSRPATQPVYSPISQLVYSTTRDQVTDVWVAGQQLLDGGRPTLADSGSILARAAAWGNKLQNGHD